MNLEELNTQILASCHLLEKKVFVIKLDTTKENNYWGPKKKKSTLCQTISFEIVSISGNSPRI